MRLIASVRRQFGGQAAFDVCCWFFAVFSVGVLLVVLDGQVIEPIPFFVTGIVLSVFALVSGKLLGLYSSRFMPATFDELLALVASAGVSWAPVALGAFLFGPLFGLPRSAVLVALPIFLLGAGGVRVVRRLAHRSRPELSTAKKSIVYGAGQMSANLIPQLLRDRESKFSPVALLDDDPAKANRWISGVKMMGTISDLNSVAKRTQAEALIVSIPRANSEMLRNISAAATPLGLDVHVLPTLSEILARKDATINLRNLEIEDLIGRSAVAVDSPSVRALLEDQTVLVTGAGGSIGLELCRQVAAFRPRRLIFLDRDETGLQQVQLAVHGNGLLDSPDVVLADIRDRDAIEEVFDLCNPDVVFHAAALKHLPTLERFPEEAWKTNVQGTLNVLVAARKSETKTFVNVSTDKAADPSSVLGRSKRVAEQLTAWASQEGDGTFLSVRFGNVLGSRGSLVPTLAHLIDSGEPLTLTHPDATRYFMTISEACQLVLQAGTEHAKQSIFVLDMGQPVRIVDIAERMVAMSGKHVEIRFTGLRPGEKLHEVFSAPGELLTRSSHERVRQLVSDVLHPDELESHHHEFITSVV